MADLQNHAGRQLDAVFRESLSGYNGKFTKWDATLTFPSTYVTSGVLDIKIYADSVDTGSGMKDDKLRSKDFFNAKEDPYITFHSRQRTPVGLQGIAVSKSMRKSFEGKAALVPAERLLPLMSAYELFRS